jgi:predicted neutral ceramidase superfamily lipid hydrolase
VHGCPLSRKLILCLSLFGCTPTFSGGTKQIHRGLNEIRAALKAETEAYSAETELAIHECRALALPTEEQRKTCLESKSPSMDGAILESSSHAYDQVVRHAEILEAQLKILEQRRPR